eukprot:gene7437-8259_t
MSKAFGDAKTFVDMPMRDDPNVIIPKLEAKLKQATTKQQVKEAVDMFFTKAGTELDNFTPNDWQDRPSILQNIDDARLKDWAKDLNNRWKNLTRKMRTEVKTKPDRFSLIYSKNPFVVPGGRFREFYYWDTYWIVKGLLLCDMKDTVRGMLQNFIEYVKKYGFVPNGGRVYYLNRSQPPFLTLMAAKYYMATNDTAFLAQTLPFLEREYDFWMKKKQVTLGAQHGFQSPVNLNHYSTPLGQPRPESYWNDVETAIEAGVYQNETERRQLFAHIASAAESGWDFSSRWFAYTGKHAMTMKSIKTRDIVPVDLNAILCRVERELSSLSASAGNATKSRIYQQAYQQRMKNINRAFWSEEKGQWLDYDMQSHKHRSEFYVSNISPIWADCFESNLTRAKVAIESIRKQGVLNYPAGVPTSLRRTGEQWDFPNAWPPLQDMMEGALRRSGHKDLAFQLAKNWIDTNYFGWKKTGHMPEKFDATVKGGIGGGGEYKVQLGFGWTNGVVLDFLNRYGDRLKAPNSGTSALMINSIQGIKLLVKWLLGLQSNQRNSAVPVFRMLDKMLKNNGDLNGNGKTSTKDKTRLRLAAAKGMINLVQDSNYADVITREQYQQLALTMKDSCYDVREKFAFKIHSGLGTLKLPLDYLAFFMLSATDQTKERKIQARQIIAKNATQRREYVKHNSQTAALQYTMLPEYSLPYAIYLMSHYPGFDQKKADSVNEAREHLWFFLEPLLGQKGDKASFLKKMTENIKQLRDAACPEDESQNEKLYVVCDLVIWLLTNKTHTVFLKEFQGSPVLPKKLFQPSAKKMKPNTKNYLPIGFHASPRGRKPIPIDVRVTSTKVKTPVKSKVTPNKRTMRVRTKESVTKTADLETETPSKYDTSRDAKFSGEEESDIVSDASADEKAPKPAKKANKPSSTRSPIRTKVAERSSKRQTTLQEIRDEVRPTRTRETRSTGRSDRAVDEKESPEDVEESPLDQIEDIGAELDASLSNESSPNDSHVVTNDTDATAKSRNNIRMTAGKRNFATKETEIEREEKPAKRPKIVKSVLSDVVASTEEPETNKEAIVASDDEPVKLNLFGFHSFLSCLVGKWMFDYCFAILVLPMRVDYATAQVEEKLLKQKDEQGQIWLVSQRFEQFYSSFRHSQWLFARCFEVTMFRCFEVTESLAVVSRFIRGC